MSNRHLESMLCDIFTAQGARNPAKLAHRAAESFDLDQRDAKIYALRATMTEQALADRFGLTPRSIRRIIKAQHALK